MGLTEILRASELHDLEALTPDEWMKVPPETADELVSAYTNDLLTISKIKVSRLRRKQCSELKWRGLINYLVFYFLFTEMIWSIRSGSGYYFYFVIKIRQTD